jgi:hypothetical protein
MTAYRNGVEVGMSRNAGFRFAQLDAGYSMLDARCWILDAGYSILDARCWILDVRCSMLDAGYSMLDARCSMLDAGYSMSLHFSIIP